MAKLQIHIKGKDVTVHAHEGFAGQQCISLQDLLGGSFSAKGATQVKQEMTVNADHQTDELVPENVRQ